MKSLIALLCITLAVFMSTSLWANTDKIPLNALNDRTSKRESHFPIDFGWLTNRYDFDQIEQYVDEYYGNYYKTWEKYVTDKQREIAGKFGLSDIFFRLNVKNYEDTKVVLSRKLLSNRIIFRYIAPVSDVRDCELYVSVKPHRFAKIIGRGHINGEKSVAIFINRPFGSKHLDRHSDRRTIRLLGRARRILNCD